MRKAGAVSLILALVVFTVFLFAVADRPRAEDAGGEHTACRRGDPVAGREVWQRYCAACHRTVGNGKTAAATLLNPQPRDFTNAAATKALSDGYLGMIIRYGGRAAGRSAAMPAGKTLADEDVADLVAYIRTLAK